MESVWPHGQSYFVVYELMSYSNCFPPSFPRMFTSMVFLLDKLIKSDRKPHSSSISDLDQRPFCRATLCLHTQGKSRYSLCTAGQTIKSERTRTRYDRWLLFSPPISSFSSFSGKKIGGERSLRQEIAEEDF